MKTKGTRLLVVGNPVACARIADPDNVDKLRRIDCASYDECLGVAVDQGWRGFRCTECQSYQAPTPERQRADMMAALTLLAETQLLPALAQEPLFVDESEDADDDAEEACGREATASEQDDPSGLRDRFDLEACN